MGELERHLLLIDAARLAVGERDRLIADPDHMRVGAADLLDEQWVGTYRRGLEGSRGLLPSTSQPDLGQTAYLCCADEDGLLISLIQSNFLGFGAGITVPRFGINLHNRGAGFSLAPGHPNEAAGRKRPLHTLMPALITRNGEPTHLLGTMGGTNQIAIQLQLLTRLLVDGVGPSEAVASPRWALGDAQVVLMESELAPSLGPAVTERGGRVEVADGEAGAVGYAQALRVIDGVVGAADPRSEGSASAVP
jgi:gamma-glutamyltranspeptidase/glutathione hydrolase